jgi:lysophospholipase L1-like esterase
MRKSLIRTAVAVLVVGFLPGVGVGALLFRHRPETWPKGVAPPVVIGTAGTYVALGDSYAAGEGLAPFQPLTDDIAKDGDRCHRSQHFAYPLLLTFVHPPNTVLRACSGAVAQNVFDVVQDHSGVRDHDGLQAAPGVLNRDVSLVTLTMGGNDIHFSSVLSFCFSNSDCPDRPYQGAPSLRDWMEAEFKSLTPELLHVYQRIRLSAPNARVLVLGYPALFPEKAPSFLNPRNAECTLILTRWDSLERSVIREWGQELNGIIQADAHEAGVDYVDVFPFFSGHEPCGPSGEWVRPLSVTSGPVRAGSFHPRQVGQEMMARVVSCYLYVHHKSSSEATKDQQLALTGCALGGVQGR